MNHLLEYLEGTVDEVPLKTAFTDGTDSISFRELSNRARAVGSALSRRGCYREPVVVYMQKHPDMVNAFFGVLYGGCWYVPLDEDVPEYRVRMIFENLSPRFVICDEKTLGRAKEMGGESEFLLFREIRDEEVDEQALREIRKKSLDIDPAYIVFTSGSTGVPKGVCACHRSVIDYIETLSE
ncbi:MAG: AMP-binding protein, partial [Eubacterium sp.]|nr:AMP-binding protein [Eubacterium sp.]